MATQGQWGGVFDGEWFGQVGESPPGAMSGSASFSISATAQASFVRVQTAPQDGPDDDEFDRRDRARWEEFIDRIRKKAERENIDEDEVILMSVMTVVLETT